MEKKSINDLFKEKVILPGQPVKAEDVEAAKNEFKQKKIDEALVRKSVYTGVLGTVLGLTAAFGGLYSYKHFAEPAKQEAKRANHQVDLELQRKEFLAAIVQQQRLNYELRSKLNTSVYFNEKKHNNHEPIFAKPGMKAIVGLESSLSGCIDDPQYGRCGYQGRYTMSIDGQDLNSDLETVFSEESSSAFLPFNLPKKEGVYQLKIGREVWLKGKEVRESMKEISMPLVVGNPDSPVVGLFDDPKVIFSEKGKTRLFSYKIIKLGNKRIDDLYAKLESYPCPGYAEERVGNLLPKEKADLTFVFKGCSEEDFSISNLTIEKDSKLVFKHEYHNFASSPLDFVNEIKFTTYSNPEGIKL